MVSKIKAVLKKKNQPINKQTHNEGSVSKTNKQKKCKRQLKELPMAKGGIILATN